MRGKYYLAMNNNHLSWNSDTTIFTNEVIENLAGPCVLSKEHWIDLLVRDIDQTDLHRFEPSSRILHRDEHSHQ